jgi:hypothetical protein
VKTRVFFGNEKWSMALSKTNMMRSNHLLQQTKQKKTKSESKDAPRKTHSIRSNKKYSVLKDDLIFADEEGVPWGIPKL